MFWQRKPCGINADILEQLKIIAEHTRRIESLVQTQTALDSLPVPAPAPASVSTLVSGTEPSTVLPFSEQLRRRAPVVLKEHYGIADSL